jgi:hypothetical protein
MDTIYTYSHGLQAIGIAVMALVFARIIITIYTPETPKSGRKWNIDV